jgi:hypothetical protein
MPDPQEFLDLIGKQQIAFEEKIQEQMTGFIDTMILGSQGGPAPTPTAPDQALDLGVVDNQSTEIDIDELKNRVTVLESAVKGNEFPISIRYRNDGATGTHRFEWIRKPTPWSDSGETTMWPDADWIPIEGADAEIYTP